MSSVQPAIAIREDGEEQPANKLGCPVATARENHAELSWIECELAEVSVVGGSVRDQSIRAIGEHIMFDNHCVTGLAGSNGDLDHGHVR